MASASTPHTANLFVHENQVWDLANVPALYLELAKHQISTGGHTESFCMAVCCRPLTVRQIGWPSAPDALCGVQRPNVEFEVSLRGQLGEVVAELPQGLSSDEMETAVKTMRRCGTTRYFTWGPENDEPVRARYKTLNEQWMCTVAKNLEKIKLGEAVCKRAQELLGSQAQIPHPAQDWTIRFGCRLKDTDMVILFAQNDADSCFRIDTSVTVYGNPLLQASIVYILNNILQQD